MFKTEFYLNIINNIIDIEELTYDLILNYVTFEEFPEFYESVIDFHIRIPKIELKIFIVRDLSLYPLFC